MKNSKHTIGNRTRNLPVCSAVPQPTPSRAQNHEPKGYILLSNVYTGSGVTLPPLEWMLVANAAPISSSIL
jgi:hypothetical protein